MVGTQCGISMTTTTFPTSHFSGSRWEDPLRKRLQPRSRSISGIPLPAPGCCEGPVGSTPARHHFTRTHLRPRRNHDPCVRFTGNSEDSQRTIADFGLLTATQWVHTDVSRAKLGTVRNHHCPRLSASVAGCFTDLGNLDVTDVGMVVNYGLNRMRFPAPVPSVRVSAWPQR